MRDMMKRRVFATPVALVLILAICMSFVFSGCSKKENSQDSTLQTEEIQAGTEQAETNDAPFSILPVAQVNPRECFDIPTYLQKTAYVGEKVEVGRVVPSEEKASDIRSYVVCGGEVIETERGQFFPQQEGVYQCVFEYTLDGERYRYSYNVEVTAKDGPVFLSDPVLPAAAAEGKTCQIPTLEAFDFLQKQPAEVTVSAWCGDDAVQITDDGVIHIPENGADALKIVWCAGTGEKQAVLERTIPVVNFGSGDDIRYAELFTGIGWNEKTAQGNGIVLTTTDQASTTFVNPVIINSTESRFGFGENDNAEAIVVTMASCQDPSVSISVAFEKGRQSEGTGKVILNGENKKDYTYAKGQTLGLRYNAVSNQFTDIEGRFLFAPEYDESGNEFKGFPGGLVSISWKVENVYGQCDLRIEKIGAQILNTSSKDLLAPSLNFNPFNSICHLGDEIVITGICAVDMVDPDAEVLISAYRGTGDNLTPVEGSYQNGVFRYTPTEPGNYTIRFQVSDSSGNDATRIRLISVFDRTKPQITIEKELSASAKCGEKLILPAASATDNEKVTVELFVIYPSGQMRMLQRGDSVQEQEYTLTEEGNYSFRYAATDKSGNCTLKDLVVQVTGNINEKGENA